MLEEQATTISVVIPSFNHMAYLRECVDSVLAQQPPPLELIVVDNGSSDGSLDILRSYGSRIRLLQHAGSGRQAGARNAGLAVAGGEWVAFLDSDDRWRPGRLAAVHAALKAVQIAQAAAAANDEGLPPPDLFWSDYSTIDAHGAVQSEQRWRPGPAAPANFSLQLIAGNPICNATVTVRRSALAAIGNFDEGLPRACDGAAWYQLAARGSPFTHLPQVLVDYRLHAANDSRAFAAMTRDRDVALQMGASAYITRGLLCTPAQRRWLRKVLMRQLAFGAAAQVQARLGPPLWSPLLALALQGLASDTGLRLLALLKTAKDAWQRWRTPKKTSQPAPKRAPP